MTELSHKQQSEVSALGRKSGKSRHQNGRVEAAGKRVRIWRGHYYVYEVNLAGEESRKHRIVDLGERSKVKKHEAQSALRAIIQKETNGGAAVPATDHTLEWFWIERYFPIKEKQWKASSCKRTKHFFTKYVLVPFGSTPLVSFDRFQVQVHLGELAGKFSKSLITKFRIYVTSLLDEAVEQDFIERNPLRKRNGRYALVMPKVSQKVCQRVLTPLEVSAISGELSRRDRLIVRMFLVLGLRPCELFALRRDDKTSGQLRVDEAVSGGIIDTPKTEASAAYVSLPEPLERDLDAWLTANPGKPEEFIFHTKNGTPLDRHNYLPDVLRPATERVLAKMKEAGMEIPAGFLKGVTHQAFRRTCATLLQSLGTVKDIQSHLRHSTPTMTVGTYMKAIPESVQKAVALLDGVLSGSEKNSKAIQNN